MTRTNPPTPLPDLTKRGKRLNHPRQTMRKNVPQGTPPVQRRLISNVHSRKQFTASKPKKKSDHEENAPPTSTTMRSTVSATEAAQERNPQGRETRKKKKSSTNSRRSKKLRITCSLQNEIRPVRKSELREFRLLPNTKTVKIDERFSVFE
jgi:hypothetical protein